MTSYRSIETLAAKQHLAIFGAFHPTEDDLLPSSIQTLLLLGPREPGFWPQVSASAAFTSARSDPLDHWSRQIIGRLACDLGGKAYFPFGGPPWHPFIAWAKRSGRAWESPVSLLVHDQAGLMVSYRGALGLTERLDLPLPPEQPPCASCTAPCRTTCPVQALSDQGYDTGACHDFLNTDPGQSCMTQGCAVRRSCPVSQSYGRLPEQSAFHMRSFHP